MPHSCCIPSSKLLFDGTVLSSKKLWWSPLWAGRPWGQAFPRACPSPPIHINPEAKNQPPKILACPQNLDVWAAEPNRVVAEQFKIQHILTNCCKAVMMLSTKFLYLAGGHGPEVFWVFIYLNLAILPSNNTFKKYLIFESTVPSVW